nr:hypothetical protein [uncultured Flavobacterium sp.]
MEQETRLFILDKSLIKVEVEEIKEWETLEELPKKAYDFIEEAEVNGDVCGFAWFLQNMNEIDLCDKLLFKTKHW